MGVSSLPLFADFSYQESSQITGGALAGVMKMASIVSKEAGQPVQSAVSVQGNRMVRSSSRRIEVIDLDQETITVIDPAKKTYSVMTFAEMREAMQKAMAKAQSKPQTTSPSGVSDIKVSLKETGESRELAGFPAKGWQMNLQMEMANEKGEKGTFVVTSDMFLAGKVAGYNEVKEFHRKMAEKLAVGMMGSGLAAMMAGSAQSAQMAKGMEAFGKEAAKMDGLPLLTITRMGASPTGEPLAIAAPDTTPTPDVKKEAGRAATQGAADAAASAVLGRLGGLGGLGGGFGRKKKEQPVPAATTPEATSSAGSAAESGVLMQMETKMDGFSAAPVDASKFAVPAGYKQVEPDMKRAGR
jgi:hypothetical protein